MFEDGRRDTSIFAQNILQNLNYKATVMTYPEKFAQKDVKFLLPKDLQELTDTSYWEVGTNGFRLEYINVFDRYNNYLGEIDPLRYAMVQQYLNRRYNHYLMDYLRDKNGVPKESYEHMKNRISYDYERLDSIYQTELGYVPQVHVLMHANTGRFGNNWDVSHINEKWIRTLFAMNFNREGDCFNRRNSSIYDLTRMQPQPYWPVNHLLMRIKYDTNKPMEFQTGDASRQEDWQVTGGVAEIGEELYTLTTEPHSKARARLVPSQDYRDLYLKARLRGNAFGSQKIFLRASEKLDNYVCVALTYDNLVVTECVNGQLRELYREKIPVILGEKLLSEEEARQEAEVGENNAFARYARSPEEAQEYLERARQRDAETEPTVEEGAKPYEGRMSYHQRMDHWLDISLKRNTLKVKLDDVPVTEYSELLNNQGGYVVLGADWQDEGWSQRNLADDVYDAVFDQLIIQSNSASKKREDEEILYTMQKSGWERVKLEAKRRWEDVLQLFISNL